MSLKWVIPDVSIPEKPRPLAVVTVAVGPHGQAQLERWGWSHAYYAETIGADHLLITGGPYNPQLPVMDKMCAVHLALSRYTRVVHLDADIQVTSNAPNVFAVVPPDAIGIYELSLFTREYYDDHVRRMDRTRLRHGICPNLLERYAFGGMAVLSSVHAPVYEIPEKILEGDVYHCFEQDLVAARINTGIYKVKWLGPNMQWVRGIGTNPKTGTHFHHYAGVPL